MRRRELSWGRLNSAHITVYLNGEIFRIFPIAPFVAKAEGSMMHETHKPTQARLISQSPSLVSLRATASEK